MNTLELLDEIKLRHGLSSDYTLAWLLDIPTSHMSHYRKRRRTLSDEMAIKVAALLEVEPGLVMTWVHQERAERAGRPDVAKHLETFAKKAATVALLAMGFVGQPSPTQAAPGAPQGPQGDQAARLCIMSNRRRRRRPWLTPLAGLFAPA